MRNPSGVFPGFTAEAALGCRRDTLYASLASSVAEDGMVRPSLEVSLSRRCHWFGDFLICCMPWGYCWIGGVRGF